MTNARHTLNAEALRELRRRSGLNGKEFAALVGISGSHLTCMEGGQDQPSWRVLLKMASVLVVPVTALITNPDPVNEQSWPFEKGRKRATA